MLDYSAVEQRGLLASVAEAAGRPLGGGLLAGREQLGLGPHGEQTC